MSKEMWEFKYAPKNFKEMILNPSIRPKLQKAIEQIPNLVLYGTAGVGKGTFANILLEETKLKQDGSMWINASDETGIDMVRTKIKPFATSLGITDMKIVVLNEADSLSQGAQGSQKMLKQLMEDVEKNCRFIFLTNNITLMMDELQSRCDVIKIDSPPGPEIFKFGERILKAEKINYKKQTILNIIKKCYPDIRSTIRCLRENTINGKLASDHRSSSEGVWESIFKMIKAIDVEGVRKALRSNYIDYTDLYKYVYENVEKFKEPGLALLSIGQHLVWDSTVAIKEINFMHMVVEMANGDMI